MANASVGVCLGGAGGGGFMTVLLNEESSLNEIKEILHDEVSHYGVSIHSGEIDFEGMVFE